MVLTIDLIKRHYRRAERAIKRCELIALAVPTPAVNQLRYAGNHALKAMTADSDMALRQRELEDAERHCRRAWFDAFDSITCYHLQQIKEFEGRGYPIGALNRFVPDYLDELSFAQKVYRLYRLPETVQQMSLEKRLAMLHDMKRIGKFANRIKDMNEAYRAALSDADDIKATLKNKLNTLRHFHRPGHAIISAWLLRKSNRFNTIFLTLQGSFLSSGA